MQKRNIMTRIFFILISISISFQMHSQNIGQKGDTLLNYTDINGLKQGNWNKTYTNGQLQYETYFIDNKPVGDFKRYNKKGDLVAWLKYTEGNSISRATLYHTNGKVAARGNYFDKNKDSIWHYFNDANVCYLTEAYKKGVKHGTFKTYTSEKALIEELNWENGVKHGPWKKYFVNGKIMWEANYINGTLEGLTKTYYKSGTIHKEGVFENDLMEGAWRTYNENGSLINVYNYDNGVCPEAEEAENIELKELLQNKDHIQGPRNSNDLDWLKGNKRY